MPSAPMERLDGLGVTLRRLQQADIEMVRCWRNQPDVRQFMSFRDTITPAMQESWFARLDPVRDHYFIIEARGQDVGLANLKDLDPVARTAEGGIFLARASERDGTVGLAAILTLYDHGFGALALATITAHILSDNARAIRFNTALGFRCDGAQEGAANPRWSLARADYLGCSARLRDFLRAAKS
jgi:RimJ/RimL family protein N-acetyltransferase